MAITGQIAASAHESTTQPSRLGESLLERIGNTPLLRLERIASKFSNVEFYAKAEWFNPGGSVKDRAALAMIEAGERSGELTRETVIIDSTSGNMDERKKWVNLVLQDRQYNKKIPYRLVLRDAETGIEQQSVEVTIDRAFTDDF